MRLHRGGNFFHAGADTDVDVSDVIEGLRGMMARGQDLRPIFRDVRELLKLDVEEHFANQQGDDGQWAPRARSSIERMRGAKGMTRRRGKLKGSFTKRGARAFVGQLGRFKYVNTYKFDVTATSISMRARGAWAGAIQYGSTGHNGARVPARPFLWASEALVARFGDALQTHLRGGF